MKAVINGCTQHVEAMKLTVSEVLARHIVTGEYYTNKIDSVTSIQTDIANEKFLNQDMFEYADGLCNGRELDNGTMYAVDNVEVDRSFKEIVTNVHGRNKTRNDASCLQGGYCDRITCKDTECEERNMLNDLDNVNDNCIEVFHLEMKNVTSGKDGDDDLDDTSWFFNDCATTVDENLLEESSNQIHNQNENVQETDTYFDKDVSEDNTVVKNGGRLDDNCNSDDTDGIVRDIERLKVHIENDLQKLMKRKDRKKHICETEHVVNNLKSDASIDAEFDSCVEESDGEFDHCFEACTLTECKSSQKKDSNERKEKLNLESEEFETIEMIFTESTEMEKIKVVNRDFVNMVKKQHNDDSSNSHGSKLGLNCVDIKQHHSLDVEIQICQNEYLNTKKLLKSVETLNKEKCIVHARDKTMIKETEPEPPGLFQESSLCNTFHENTQLPNETPQNLTDHSPCRSISHCLDRHAHKSHTDGQIQKINALLHTIGKGGETFKSMVSLKLHSRHVHESDIGQLDTDNTADFDSGFSSTDNPDSDRSAVQVTKSDEFPVNQDTFSDSHTPFSVAQENQPTTADVVPCKEQSINRTSGCKDNIDSTGNWNKLDEANHTKDHHSVPNIVDESCRSFSDTMTKQPGCVDAVSCKDVVKTIVYTDRSSKFSDRFCGNECKTEKFILEKKCHSHLCSEPYNAYIDVQGNRSLNVPSKVIGESKSGGKINLKRINNMLKDISVMPGVSTATKTLGSTRPGFSHSRHMNSVNADDSEVQQLIPELKEVMAQIPLTSGVGLSHINSVNVSNDVSLSKHESNTESDMTPTSKKPNMYRNSHVNVSNAVINANISSVAHLADKHPYKENDNVKACEVEEGRNICKRTIGEDERSHSINEEDELNEEVGRLVTGQTNDGDERFVNITKEKLKDDIKKLVIGLNYDGDDSISSAVCDVVVRQSEPGNLR